VYKRTIHLHNIHKINDSKDESIDYINNLSKYITTRRVSRRTFIRYAQGQNIWKPNNLKSLGARKPKWPTQDRQNQLRSPMPEGVLRVIIHIISTHNSEVGTSRRYLNLKDQSECAVNYKVIISSSFTLLAIKDVDYWWLVKFGQLVLY
jgi:hypothetical protein